MLNMLRKVNRVQQCVFSFKTKHPKYPYDDLYILDKKGITTSPQYFVKNDLPSHLSFVSLYKGLEDSNRKVYKDVFGVEDPKKVIQKKEDVQVNLRKVVPWLTETDVITILYHYDQPTYTFKEFSQLVNHIQGFRQTMDFILGNAFKQYDSDEDGKLDHNELKRLVDVTYGSESDRQREEILRHIQKNDKDGDGKITAADFNDYYWRMSRLNPFSNNIRLKDVKKKPTVKGEKFDR